MTFFRRRFRRRRNGTSRRKLTHLNNTALLINHRVSNYGAPMRTRGF